MHRPPMGKSGAGRLSHRFRRPRCYKFTMKSLVTGSECYVRAIERAASGLERVALITTVQMKPN